jgi:hypothetical protein
MRFTPRNDSLGVLSRQRIVARSSRTTISSTSKEVVASAMRSCQKRRQAS